MIQTHSQWAQPMTDDINSALHSVTVTALSIHHPRSTKQSPYASLFTALRAAAERGLSVTVLAPAPSKTHPATAQNANTLAALAEIGAITHLIPLPGLLHAKTCVIDNSIVWIGSGNWTAAAAHYNREMYTRLVSARVARKLQGQVLSLASGMSGLDGAPW